MAIIEEFGKGQMILDLSFDVAADLSDLQYCAVIYTASVSSGKATLSAPGGQGVICAGILQNSDADTAGDNGNIRTIGTSKVKANATFDAGVELTIADSTGELEAASSGDYVVAISLQAAAEANHLVYAQLVTPYQKN